MTRVLLDSNVFIHALGEHPELRAACREVLARGAAGDLVVEASVLVVDELVHVRHRRSRDRRAAVEDGRAAAALVVLHPITPHEVEAALRIFLDHQGLQMRDAIHVATARHQGIGVLVSTDRGFDGVAGLTRVDPADAAAVAALDTG